MVRAGGRGGCDGKTLASPLSSGGEVSEERRERGQFALSGVFFRLWSDPRGGWKEAETRMINHRQRLVERGVAADGLQPEWCLQN